MFWLDSCFNINITINFNNNIYLNIKMTGWKPLAAAGGANPIQLPQYRLTIQLHTSLQCHFYCKMFMCFLSFLFWKVLSLSFT